MITSKQGGASKKEGFRRRGKGYSLPLGNGGGGPLGANKELDVGFAESRREVWSNPGRGEGMSFALEEDQKTKSVCEE